MGDLRDSAGTMVAEVAPTTPVASPKLRSPPSAATLALTRDLRLAFRKRGQLVQPLVFFAIVTTLFPLAISPELSRLRDVRARCVVGGRLVILAACARVPV